MSDILSGGRIDESASGPIPSNADDRDGDIIAEQKENQRQNAIGGTEEPPKSRPPEQIPEPPQVAPPLPVVPSFDFSIAGSALEETREIARQTVVDVIKNVTINGQGPSVEGSTISFNIPQQPPASEVFLFQGVAIPQSQISLIPQIPLPQPPLESPQAERQAQPTQIEIPQEIQSVVVAPPARTPQVEQPQIETPPTISVAPPQERVEQPRITTTPSISVTVPQEETEQPQEQSPQPARSVSVQVPQTEESAIEEPQVSITTPAQQPFKLDLPESVTTPPLPETTAIAQLPSEPPPVPKVPDGSVEQPTVDSPEIETSENVIPRVATAIDEAIAAVLPEAAAIQADITAVVTGEEDIPFVSPVSGDKPQAGPVKPEEPETTSTTQEIDIQETERPTLGQKEVDTDEGKKDTKSRAERDPFYDRESDIRQRGETPREFKERQEELKQERAEAAKAEIEKREFLKRAREGDLTEMPSGMVPVRFTRADGKRKILALVATELVGTVEGATAGERTLTLPPDSAYYIGGTGPPHPWQILLRTIPETDPPQYEFKVELNSRLYKGLGDWNNVTVSGLNSWSSVSEDQYVVLNGNVDNGECTDASIEMVDTLPNRINFEGENQNKFSVQIGFFFTANDSILVRQNAFHNFTIIDTCIGGKLAIYPLPT
jgi:hypothetical protein